MERTGVTPSGAVVAPDLAEIVKGPGPFVTVYLTTEAATENAAYHSEQHWKSVRRDLADLGAAEAVLAQIDPLVPDAHLHGKALAIVADSAQILHVEHGQEPPARDVADVAPLPSLLPVLAIRQASPAYMTIRADRAGADIAVYRRERLTAERETGGGTDPLARSKPGGWSQRRYQQRAENTWEQNAEDTALDVTRLFERFDPRLIVLAGDERAVQLIEEALPTTVLDRLVVVEGGRSEDGSDDLFAGRVQEQVTAAVNLDTYMLLEKFREELGQADRAADGPDDVLAALARAQVEVLLVHDSPADERTALFGPEPAQVGRAADDLRAMGVDEPQEARLVDVAVRAALGTGAGVRILPDGDVPTGRLGAILRWS